MLRGGLAIWKPECEARIPKDLPVLIISGAMDPVGGFGAGVNLLAGRYQAQRIDDLTVKLYPEARHELLNELNRDQVHQDVLTWLDQRSIDV